MKKIASILFFLIAFSAFAGGKTEFYKELAFSITQPQRLEGLWPLINPTGSQHYQFDFDEKHRLLRVTHFDEKGNLAVGEDGWAIFKLVYDEQGRILESSFHDNNGGLTQSRKLGFAREVSGIYYSAKGRELKTLRNNLGIAPMEGAPK